MKLLSVETTPNPNSMKLNLDQSFDKAVTYSNADIGSCPPIVESLLRIDGVQTVFACADFMTVNKDPRADWKIVLESAALVFGGASAAQTNSGTSDSLGAETSIGAPASTAASDAEGVDKLRLTAEKTGQVTILVQTFKGIPIQVKASDVAGEKRVALPERFSRAAQSIQASTGADYLKERYWADWGVRYGALEEIANEVVDEIEGGIDEAAIEKLVAKALQVGNGAAAGDARSLEELMSVLKNDDWHQRLLAVQELSTLDGSFGYLVEALSDSNAQVRRLAAAALGASGNDAAVQPLCDVLLNDSAPGVRRTAGDALSDIGSASGQPAMCKALSDVNKLVRWRAARFLFELGDQSALPALLKAAADPEFEVRLEVQAAEERIVQGREGSLPAWKRILNDTSTGASN